MITQFQAICIMEISDLVYLDREILGIFRQTGTLKGLLSENFQSCFSKFRQKESFGKLLSEKTEIFFPGITFLEVLLCYFPTKSSSKGLFVGIFSFQTLYFPTKGCFLCYFVGK